MKVSLTSSVLKSAKSKTKHVTNQTTTLVLTTISLNQALYKLRGPPPLSLCDILSTRKTVTLPGLIDVHVHLRDPGATHKESFTTGTSAALAGGVTMVCAMPNTNPPIVDRESFELASKIATSGAVCDYALFVGASLKNWDTVCELAPQAAALKMYLCDTYTTLRLDDNTVWLKHLQVLSGKVLIAILCHVRFYLMFSPVSPSISCIILHLRMTH